MTINTHSYLESGNDKKFKIFTDAINRISPDIVAMQEVNQPRENQTVYSPYLVFQHGIPLKADNFSLNVINELSKLDNPY